MMRETVTGFDNLAKYSGVSEHFLRLAYSLGEMPFEATWHMGSIYKFDKADVDSWIESGGAERLKNHPRTLGGYTVEVSPELAVLARQNETALNALSNFEVDCLLGGELDKLMNLTDEDFQALHYVRFIADRVLLKAALVVQCLDAADCSYARGQVQSASDSDLKALEIASAFKSVRPLFDAEIEHTRVENAGVSLVGIRAYLLDQEIEIRSRRDPDFDADAYYEAEIDRLQKKRGR